MWFLDNGTILFFQLGQQHRRLLFPFFVKLVLFYNPNPYNEVKFTVSVASPHQIGDGKKNISEYTSNFARLIEYLVSAVEDSPDLQQVDGKAS